MFKLLLIGTPIKLWERIVIQKHKDICNALIQLQIIKHFPSFLYEKISYFHAFMEDNLFKGQALKSGYCRNDIFFDIQRKNMVRKELGFVGKKVFAYLPTFRGIAGNFESKKQLLDIEKFCDELIY